MSQQDFTPTENVRKVLEEFLDDLNARLSAQELEAVLSGTSDRLMSRDIGNKPEAYTADKLIRPLFDAVGLSTDPQPYGKAGERDRWPDTELTNVDADVIGEYKLLNRVEDAHSQIKDYLDRKSLGAEYGIATDGVEWYIYKIELEGDFTEYPLIEEVSLRGALLAIARERNYIGSTGLEEVDIEEELSEFIEVFERDAFNELLSQRAPRELRDNRKRDIEEFYELYIELLFGVSEEHSYETCLIEDIKSPRSATEHEERLFGITLMNRLLFIKFLETRGVLDTGFLKERVVDYEKNADDFAGNLYETQIKPLFYKLLNTPEESREPKYRDEEKWFSGVPYLNGGLFRENIPQERRYSVNDRTLPVVIRDLIEGSELELNGRGFDPAILGSVFEKTINHIEQERTQKDIGAYYTPNDVTNLIISQSVDPKIHDVIINAIAEECGPDEDATAKIRENLQEFDLAEILRRIEDRDGWWFGNPDAIKQALEGLRNLKIIDPACGSGHFLTNAMDEIHRAQVSLLRCLNEGDDPTSEERYNEKQQLALNAIYGVDVDDIAAEIAKLRIWLKIVEGNSWEPSFGKLPNIDVNITDGNSLIGLPMTGSFDNVDIWSEDIQEIEHRRRQYKKSNSGDPRELQRFMEREIRPKLDEEYLEMYSKPVETDILSVEEFDAICEAVDGNLYPDIQMIRVRHKNGKSLEEYEDRLEEMGFSVYKKSAKINIQEWESKLKRMDSVDNHRSYLEGKLRKLLEEGLIFAEVERQPLTYDLEQIQGKPFHWVAEFPEVASKNGGKYSINFDIILGNPPYGNLLNDHETMFISTYATAGINEISAQFVERELQLLADEGFFGNITTLRLVYQSGHEEFNELLRQNLDPVKAACFGLRGRTGVFDNALVRVAIFTGQKNREEDGEIRTSDLILFTEENREQRLNNIEYSSTQGLLLRDKIGGMGSKGPTLPKVGSGVKRDILNHLSKSSNLVFKGVFSRDKTEDAVYPVWRSGSGGYWINPMLEKLYDATDIEPLYFDSKLSQNTAFLILNSSLYYLYWVTYGNQRNHSWSTLEAFPWPDREAIENQEDVINKLSQTLWKRMEGTFQKAHGSRGRFVMSSLRPIIDDVDILVGKLYGLSDDQIEYLQKYHTDIGEGSARAGKPDEDISYTSFFEKDSNELREACLENSG